MEFVFWIGIPFLILLVGLVYRTQLCKVEYGQVRHGQAGLPRAGTTLSLSPIPILGLLVVLTGSVLGHEFFNVPVGPIPLTLDRGLLLATAALFAFYYVTNQEKIAKFNSLDVAIMLLIGVIGISTITHNWRFLKNMPASRLLFFNLLPVMLYWLVRNSRLKANDLKVIAVTLTVLGVYLALTAVAEVKGVTAVVFPRYIMTSETVEFLGRGRGPFVNPVSNGIFMIVCLCCTLMWWPRSWMGVKFLVVGIALLSAVGCYATLTRSIWLSLIVACGIFVWMPSSRQAKGAMVVSATLVGICLFPVLSEKLFSFKRDKDVSVTQMAVSAQMRPMFFYVATKMFQDRPVLGVGFGQYADAKTPYLSDPNSGKPLMITKTLMQHNVFLAYLTETGLIGLSALALMLLLMLFTSWKVWKNGSLNLWARQFGLLGVVMLSCYCINGMFHDVSIIPMNHVFLFFLLGLINNIYSNTNAFASEGQTVLVTGSASAIPVDGTVSSSQGWAT